MTPRQRYLNEVESGRIELDEAQLRAVDALTQLHQALLAAPTEVQSRRQGGLFSRWFGRSEPEPASPRGIYLWGDVGRGKTFLVDLFYDSLGPVTGIGKRRQHFHHFMRDVHAQTRVHERQQDPLRIIAQDYARQFKVLCLDEMHVNDITDAMLMGRLLSGLFDNGVVLLTTSNFAPDDLYKNGLQRARFLPAIEQIKAHTQVVELTADQDYRLRALASAPIYYLTGDMNAARAMQERFDGMAQIKTHAGEKSVQINGRDIEVIERAEDVIWCSFAALCETARSTPDYIDLATCYHTVFISDVPVMGDNDNDAARRFINLIDELYDRGVKLVLSAAAEPEGLYVGQRQQMEFKRTVSRLIEMRSMAYLEAPHRVI